MPVLRRKQLLAAIHPNNGAVWQQNLSSCSCRSSKLAEPKSQNWLQAAVAISCVDSPAVGTAARHPSSPCRPARLSVGGTVYVSMFALTATSAGRASRTSRAHAWVPSGLVGFCVSWLHHLSGISNGLARMYSCVARLHDEPYRRSHSCRPFLQAA